MTEATSSRWCCTTQLVYLGDIFHSHKQQRTAKDSKAVRIPRTRRTGYHEEREAPQTGRWSDKGGSLRTYSTRATSFSTRLVSARLRALLDYQYSWRPGVRSIPKDFVYPMKMNGNYPHWWTRPARRQTCQLSD